MGRATRGKSGGTGSETSSSVDDKRKKRIFLLIDRLENILVTKELIDGAVQINWSVIKDKIHCGSYIQSRDALEHTGFDTKLKTKFTLRHRGVDWTAVKKDIQQQTDFLGQAVFDKYLSEEITFEEERESAGQLELLLAAKQNTYKVHNGLAMIQGKWKKEAYADREYTPINDYVVTDSVSPDTVLSIQEQLRSSLHDGYHGPALNCGDQEETELWMRKFSVDGVNIVDEDSIVQWQVNSCMEHLLGAVEDQVCNDIGVVSRDVIGLGPQLKEVPVWGIDCYTRRNIELVLCDCIMAKTGDSEENMYNNVQVISQAQDYIEQYLLPTINMQPRESAHDISYSLRTLIQNEFLCIEARQYAQALLSAYDLLGADLFRIHPKGTGVLCTNPDGIPPHTVISDYLGEVYPPYRWCEKLAVLEKTQTHFGLKPTLPDFYNILLERHRTDADGYGLLFVDASQRANMGSSCSHSCNANCTSSVVVRDGKTKIVQTTNRFVRYGEELCMDYYSVTSSEVEWRAAICLCGMRQCRGSFLHFSTQEELQQVLNKYCSPLYRFAALAKSCAEVKISADADELFLKFGMLKYAIGENCPEWLRKYGLEILRFVQYERKSLPCALLRDNMKSKHPMPNYSYYNADAEARCVMESRLQAMVISFSVIRHMLAQQEKLMKSRRSTSAQVPAPVSRLQMSQAIGLVWANMSIIPDLLITHLISRRHKNKSIQEKSKVLDSANGKSESFESVVHEGVGLGASPVPLPTFSATDLESLPLGALLPEPPAIKPHIPTKEEKNAAKVRSIAEKIRNIHKSEVPTNYAQMSIGILKIRQELSDLISMSTPRARIQQLSDVLVFWSQTVNFIFTNTYLPVDCIPVKVYARELGNNISRATISSTAVPPRNIPATAESVASGITSRVDGLVFDSSYNTETALCTEQFAEIVRSTSKLETPNAASCQSLELFEDISATKSMDIIINESAESDFSTVSSTLCTPSVAVSICDEQFGLTPSLFSEQNPDIKGRVSTETALVSPDVKISASVVEKEEFFEPNEVVHIDTFTYHPMFMLWQLMGWFNAGSDDPITAPNVFGTLQLPLPSQCFGVAESTYGIKERDALLKHVTDEFKQSSPWPDEVTKTFSKIPRNTPRERASLMGSPFLDILLGGSCDVIAEMASYLRPGGLNKIKQKTDHKSKQFDELLPPDSGCSWSMCAMCTKWRRVAWYIDADSLGDVWTCSMNYWDLSKASCNVEEDYNSEHEDCDDAENYKDFDVNEYLASLPKGSLDSCPVDSVKDVYCVRNKVWFKGKILKHLNSSETGRTSDSVLIHFQGWHSKYDESIDVDSGRIQPLGIFSNLPTTAEIRQKKLGRSAPVRSKSKESQKRNENKTGAASLNKKRKIATLSVKPPLKKIKKGSAVKE